MSSKVEPLRDEGSRKQVVLAGAIAGLVSRFCIAPLDVIKIRLQLQSYSLADPSFNPRSQKQRPMYDGTIATLKKILVEEGITGLWKGNVPAEAMYVAYGGIQFLSYRSVTQALNALPDEYKLPGTGVSFIAGALAGTAATTVTYPLDLLRTRFAAQGNERVYTSLFASIRDIGRYEGPKGYFRGLSAGVGQIVPYMGLFFSFYELLKPTFANLVLPLESLGSSDGTAGMCASVMAKTIVFPLDTVRKRLQVQGPTRAKYVFRNIPAYEAGLWGTVRAIVRREGIRGLYRGLPVGLIKAAPASAATMWTYERAMGVIRRFDGED
ncbi:hypothetical protein AAFC00_002828 [Neodothiora populina]|uniref:Mitochondrial thiamine pyrophosphate carrier 1 n=1 Tax=Neodothiora populina TaxID=2781224 RepID=A0ABR3P8N6_9PEZI